MSSQLYFHLKTEEGPETTQLISTSFLTQAIV
jgi:hypothetical protein